MTITIVNPFEVPKGRESEAMCAWDKFGEYFSKQEGYISAQLLKSTDDNNVHSFVTLAKWADEESYKRAISSKELEDLAKTQPSYKRNPKIYQIVRNN